VRRSGFSRREFLAAAAASLSVGGRALAAGEPAAGPGAPDTILRNARITTLDARRPSAQALAVRGDRIVAVGDEASVMAQRGPATRVVDLAGRSVIPGLNDSHIHVIRGGLNYDMELRWDGVPSLSDAMAMLREQARRTPAPQWVRVVGGWSEFQFAERRLPTLAELNAASPDVPVFVLHLYDRALLNAAALRAVGYTRETPDPPGGEIARDKSGNPTGLLIARPNANLLYKTLSLGPKLDPDAQALSTRHFMRELNRFGLTSIIDAGGGFQNFPDDYQVIEKLHGEGLLTLRFAYNLFTQNAGREREDFARWIGITEPGRGDDFYRMNGAGEMLVFSAADFEDFLEPRPELPPTMEPQLREVVKLLVAHRWPFRLHATYDESIARFLSVFEDVNREIPFAGLRWFFDHAETISPRNLERVSALGGGIAVQHRMAFQGEYFVERYGAQAAAQAPPIARMLAAGIPVGAGTDATRVASYNPWVALHWLVTGRTLGGAALHPGANRLDRAQALRLYTQGSAWFSGEEQTKGVIAPGQLADLAVLSADYFSVPEAEIPRIESVLTMTGGKIVYGKGELAPLAPPPAPAGTSWSPAAHFGGYGAPGFAAGRKAATARHGAESYRMHAHRHPHVAAPLWSGIGCDCFAF